MGRTSNARPYVYPVWRTRNARLMRNTEYEMQNAELAFPPWGRWALRIYPKRSDEVVKPIDINYYLIRRTSNARPYGYLIRQGKALPPSPRGRLNKGGVYLIRRTSNARPYGGFPKREAKEKEK